jgi:protein TonB
MKKKPLRRPPQPRSPVHLEVKAAAPRKINVSAGVIAGNRLAGMTPQYPAIAKAERIQGTVSLWAEISTAGTVENLKVISGPPMLQQSAVEAVKTYRYKPYLSRGKPVIVLIAGESCL